MSWGAPGMRYPDCVNLPNGGVGPPPWYGATCWSWLCSEVNCGNGVGCWCEVVIEDALAQSRPALAPPEPEYPLPFVPRSGWVSADPPAALRSLRSYIRGADSPPSADQHYAPTPAVVLDRICKCHATRAATQEVHLRIDSSSMSPIIRFNPMRAFDRDLGDIRDAAGQVKWSSLFRKPRHFVRKEVSLPISLWPDLLGDEEERVVCRVVAWSDTDEWYVVKLLHEGDYRAATEQILVEKALIIPRIASVALSSASQDYEDYMDGVWGVEDH